jgi:hypothetical protein
MNYFFKFRRHLKFKYDVTNSNWIDINSIIILVTMTYDKAKNVYTLSNVNVEILDGFVSNNNDMYFDVNLIFMLR